MQNRNAEPEPVAVLLIDDDPISREVLSTLLGMSGFTVETADDGAAAVSLLESKLCSPSLILMDAQMPGLSGLELIHALRLRTGAHIVLISASEPAAELRTAADGFLLKPFDAAEVRHLWAETLSEAAHQQGKAAEDRPFAQAEAESAEPVVSAQTLAQLRSMMPAAAVREIFTALVADCDRRMIALDAAIAAQDAAEARRIGHALKGGAAMAGAAQLARLGALIESGALEIPATAAVTSSQRNQLDNSSALPADLRRAARNLRRMLDEDSFAP
jgi:CheY-like chemotaxis protein